MFNLPFRQYQLSCAFLSCSTKVSKSWYHFQKLWVCIITHWVLFEMWFGPQWWGIYHWATIEIPATGFPWILTSVYVFFQLSFLRGEKILILRQTTADWWWGERAGCCGYIPANHLGKHLEECDPEDTWQDEEYFGSYGTLVLLSTFPVRLARWWFKVSFSWAASLHGLEQGL